MFQWLKRPMTSGTTTLKNSKIKFCALSPDTLRAIILTITPKIFATLEKINCIVIRLCKAGVDVGTTTSVFSHNSKNCIGRPMLDMSDAQRLPSNASVGAKQIVCAVQMMTVTGDGESAL